MAERNLRRYRCTYSPLTIDGYVVASESGVLPFIDVQATCAEDAMRRAYAAKAAPIANVERLEEPAPKVRAPRKARPVIKLITGAAMLAGLIACGGGDDHDVDSPPMDCHTRPELCK